MRHFISTTLLISAACLAGAAQAGGDYLQGWGVAPQTRFYVGGSLGVAEQNGYDDGGSSAGKLYGGVRYGRYLGAELGYVKLGSIESDLKDRLETLAESDTSGLYAAAMGYLPVAHRTELMGKVGVMRWDTDMTKNQRLIGSKVEDNDSGTSPLIGIGAQYHMNPNMFLRGEWERAFGTGNDDHETDVDLLTVGVTVSTY